MNRELILEPGAMVEEKPITFSEVTAAMYDLEFVGTPEAIGNAQAALLRAKMGPGENEQWMVEPGNTLWEMQVDMLQTRIDAIS